MAHRTLKRSSYEHLVDRLNRFPQGAPPSETLYKILRVLVTEREAGLLALLPIKPFGAHEAAKRWRMSEADARRVLDELAGRAILVDVERDEQSVYTLPPPMAGFFEFSMHVLDYERASEVIRTASHIGVGICYCRHKMEHMGRSCDAPMEICMTFNSSAESLTRSGYA